MKTQIANVVLPQDLVAEIDAIVGARDRDTFVANLTRAELTRRKLLAFLESKGPVMKDEDHPEFAEGTVAWVKKKSP